MCIRDCWSSPPDTLQLLRRNRTFDRSRMLKMLFFILRCNEEMQTSSKKKPKMRIPTNKASLLLRWSLFRYPYNVVDLSCWTREDTHICHCFLKHSGQSRRCLEESREKRYHETRVIQVKEDLGVRNPSTTVHMALGPQESKQAEAAVVNVDMKSSICYLGKTIGSAHI
jgi:hypothetical protein